MNWDELREVWTIPEPSLVRSITLGINNLTQVLETTSGNYVLRTYPIDRSFKHIRYELNVLRNLQQKNLPFQIPTPIPTLAGESFAILSEEIFTLSPWLAGAIPQNDNLEQAYAAGQALSELVKALVDIEVEITPQVAPFPLSGDFEGWARIPIRPVELVQSLPLTRDEQIQTLILLERTQTLTSSLYQTLPQQIIHRDYDQSNILMEGNLVTGVLDFEFCGPDLRILDLAYALSQWPYGLWNTGKEWLVIDAFAQGYLRRQRLTSPELEALPYVFRLRDARTIFFRLGRYRQGLETQESMCERIQEILINESWLEKHEKELLSHIHGW